MILFHIKQYENNIGDLLTYIYMHEALDWGNEMASVII